MKKRNEIFLHLLATVSACILALFFSGITIYADSSNGYVSQSPWEYGELKDGLFVRPSMDDELSWINQGDPRYFDEATIARKARERNELTPEMEAAGYQLLFGVPVPPDNGEGKTESDIEVIVVRTNSDITNNDLVRAENGYGYVTLTATVNREIDQPCFVCVKTSSEDVMFRFDLYPENNYSTTSALPVGDYVCMEGGVPEDYKGMFSFEGDNFSINKGASTVASVFIGTSRKEILNKNENIDQKEESTESTSEQKIDLPEDSGDDKIGVEIKKSPSPIIKLLKSAILPVLAILVCLFILIQKKKKEMDE